MPRNRKRAKDRRTPRPANAGGRPGLATAGGGAPDPIAHGTPDVELAEAQLAAASPGPFDEDDPELEAELEAEAEASLAPADGGRGGRSGRRGSSLEGDGGEVSVPGGGPREVAPHRVGLLARLIGFLQGSWRELQRVQWPDRRQVVQATSVVLGFVVVAGLFLALADFLASHIVTFILQGHW